MPVIHVVEFKIGDVVRMANHHYAFQDMEVVEISYLDPDVPASKGFVTSRPYIDPDTKGPAAERNFWGLTDNTEFILLERQP